MVKRCSVIGTILRDIPEAYGWEFFDPDDEEQDDLSIIFPMDDEQGEQI